MRCQSGCLYFLLLHEGYVFMMKSYKKVMILVCCVWTGNQFGNFGFLKQCFNKLSFFKVRSLYQKNGNCLAPIRKYTMPELNEKDALLARIKYEQKEAAELLKIRQNELEKSEKNIAGLPESELLKWGLTAVTYKTPAPFVWTQHSRACDPLRDPQEAKAKKLIALCVKEPETGKEFSLLDYGSEKRNERFLDSELKQRCPDLNYVQIKNLKNILVNYHTLKASIAEGNRIAANQPSENSSMEELNQLRKNLDLVSQKAYDQITFHAQVDDYVKGRTKSHLAEEE